MRNRTWSRLIPLVEAVPPNQFRLSDELLAIAGPLWSRPDDLSEFVAQVVAGCEPSGRQLLAAVPGSPGLFTVSSTVSPWCRSVQEAKLHTIRIPANLVEEAKRAQLLRRYDLAYTAAELYRLVGRIPGAPDSLVQPVRECTDARPSAERWSRLERAVKGFVLGGWLSPADVRMALRKQG